MSAWNEYKKTMVEPPTLGGAVKAGNVHEIERLLATGQPIDEKDTRGYSPLMLAAYGGHEAPFEFLLARGADPNTCDGAGNSVLMGASFKGHLAMVRKLVAAGADPSRKNAAGLDARGFAQMFGRTEVIAYFDALSPS